MHKSMQSKIQMQMQRRTNSLQPITECTAPTVHECKISTLQQKSVFTIFLSDDCLVGETPSYNSINFHPLHLHLYTF